MATASSIHQINLSRVFGGGETFALLFNRALRELGIEAVLHVHSQASWWRNANLYGARVSTSSSLEELSAGIPDNSTIVTHTSLYPGATASLSRRHFLSGFAHMPMWGRNAAAFSDYAYVFPVSRHVEDSLRAIGCRNVHDEPLYGSVDFSRFTNSAGAPAEIKAHRILVSDRRKVRDKLLEGLQPLVYKLLPERRFEKKSGLTLGVMSMLGPIKQFPLLFSILSPVLAKHPDINLEIFGYGGYGYVRDMRTALSPIRRQVRFWGEQTRPEIVYPQMDYLLSGLPEKEALGLNILEAQFAGTPVLAVNAPPFTETVVDGVSGFLYRDPREDGGAHFGEVLERIKSSPRPDPRLAVEHLHKFSFEAFTQRVGRAIASAERIKNSAGKTAAQPQ